MPKPSLFPTRWRWALSILGAVLLLMMAAWLALPRWLAGPGAEKISQALGRNFSVAEVHFQPWSLTLELDGIRIAGAGLKDPPLLTIVRAEASMSLRSIWHASPVLSSLQIDHPVLRLARVAPGRYDIDDLLARFNQPSPQASAKPAQFGLYNIRLQRGQVLLDDRPLSRQHELSDLQLDLPFISTLDADVKLAVQPKLSGKVNGVAFGSDAQLLPFADSPDAKLDFTLNGLDLAPYIAYIPEGLPLRLQRGHIDARLTVHFTQAPKQTPMLQLSGEVGLTDIALQTLAGEPWLSWQELRVQLKDIQPLQRQIRLGSVRWSGPSLALHTDASGKLWLPGESSDPSPAEPKAAPWRVSLDSFDLSQAALAWSDDSLSSPVKLQASELQAQLGPLAWPLPNDAAVTVSYALHLDAKDSKAAPATLTGEARLTQEQLTLGLQWQDLTLAWVAPYAQMPFSLQGQAGGRVEVALARPLDADAAQRLIVTAKDLDLADLAVGARHSAEPLLRWTNAKLDELKLDLGARSIQAGELTLTQPVVQAARDRDGHWSHEAMLPPPHESEAGPAWHLQARSFRIDQGSVRIQDALAGDQPMQADKIQLRLQNLIWPASAEPIPAQLSLAVARPRAKDPTASRMQFQGQVLLGPLAVSGKLQADQLPLHWLDPYLDSAAGVQLRRAELGLKGEFAATQKPDGLQATWHGDALLAHLRINQRSTGDELLGWQTLDLTGMSLSIKPGGPPEATIASARLDDYYMRLNVNDQGRFNITDLGTHAEPAEPAEPAKAAAPAPASSAPAFLLTVGETRFSKGEVDFSDHFIRPNYSARLSALEGSLGAFATGKPAMAPLSLRGKVQGTGDLTIEGQVNPLSSPPAMDIKAHASDIELSPLSPYAAKYAGYAIERGKLSTQVEYKIDSTGLLQASNKIRLDQLTFGERVESPDATTLPVRLAVALLKDSDGVIDVDLPVSGSINDPDFSIGGLVFKLIGNLIGKALTAPFSLFSGGGDADVSSASFAPGSAAIATPDQLDKVAKMLGERPALELTITGWADAGVDGPALQQSLAKAAADAERRRDLRRQQKSADGQLAAATKKALPSIQAVSDAQLQELATQRSAAIRDALMARGVPNSRLFLGSPRVNDGPAADWQPHADLSLSAQ